MSKGKWLNGAVSENTAYQEFRQCEVDDCDVWFTWREEREHLENVHGLYEYKGKLVGIPKEPDPLHVRVARLKRIIARTPARNGELLYELRKGLIQLESQLVASRLDLRIGNSNGLECVSAMDVIETASRNAGKQEYAIDYGNART